MENCSIFSLSLSLSLVFLCFFQQKYKTKFINNIQMKINYTRSKANKHGITQHNLWWITKKIIHTERRRKKYNDKQQMYVESTKKRSTSKNMLQIGIFFVVLWLHGTRTIGSTNNYDTYITTRKKMFLIFVVVIVSFASLLLAELCAAVHIVVIFIVGAA